MQFPTKFEEALQMVSAEDETPLFIQDCKVFKNLFFSKKRVIIITERSIFYFSKRMNKHKFNILKICSLFVDKNAISIDFSGGSNIKIDYKSKNELNLKENLLDSLFFVIQHLLTDSDIESIQLNNSVQKFNCIQSYFGTFCHFESMLRNEFFNFHTQSHDIFDQIRFRFSIIFHRKLIELSSYTNKEYSSKLVLETIQLLPSAKYLKIKQFKSNNIYSFLNNYVGSLKSLQNIEIDGIVDCKDDSFNNFLISLKQNSDSKMVGLSFMNSNFNENHLNLINEYLSSNKIKALEFHNAFTNKTVTDFFITNFLTSLSLCPDFTSLYIDEINSLDIDKFLQNLPEQIQSLSIVNCDVLINDVLGTIKTNSKFSAHLNLLNLSYNILDTFHGFNIPDFLNVIILDYVTFSNGTLVPFLNSLFRSINDDSEISLIQIKASDDDFSNLDRMFYQLVTDFQNRKEDLKYIRSLNWNFNPISTYFISFLEMQTRLKSLSVSGCFCPRDYKGFDLFCSYLTSNVSLTKLTCRRFNKISLESMTPRLLSAVSFSKISFLDISNSRGGSNCYEYLKELINIDDKNLHNQNSINDDKRNINLSETNNKNKIDENDNAKELMDNQNNEIKINRSSANIPITSSSYRFSMENFPGISKESNLKCVIYDGLMPLNKFHLMDFIEFTCKNKLLNYFSFPIHDIEYLYKKQKIGFDDITKIISQCQIITSNDYIRPFTVFYKENWQHYPFYFQNENENISSQITQPLETESNNDSTENEMKTVTFFGLYHDTFEKSNITINDPYIFSFHSDDDDESESKKVTFSSMNKYPNSNKSEMNYLKSTIKIDNDTVIPSLIIDDDEEEESSYSSQIITNNKSKSMKTDYDSYSYDYSNDEDEKTIKNTNKQTPNKSIPLNKTRAPFIRPVLQRRIFANRTLNNRNIIKRPVLQISLDDSSYYSYYSDD